jgi:hypothetical protein
MFPTHLLGLNLGIYFLEILHSKQALDYMIQKELVEPPS